MSRSLFDLEPAFRLRVLMFQQAAEKVFGSITIIDTLRTKEEQAINIKNGVSWTKNSKHLADKEGYAHAVDMAPTYLIKMKNWAPKHPDWQKFGALGESFGLKWGGRWPQRDNSHFESHAKTKNLHHKVRK